MKAVLTRSRHVRNPDHTAAIEAGKDTRGIPVYLEKPAGTVIEHPDAYKLCRLGCAVPGDQECRDKCGLSDEQITKASQGLDKLEAGIGEDGEPGGFYPPNNDPGQEIDQELEDAA